MLKTGSEGRSDVGVSTCQTFIYETKKNKVSRRLVEVIITINVPCGYVREQYFYFN
jgi:hypothetical protein